MLIQCSVDDRTYKWLERIAKERRGCGQTAEIDQLAEDAISESALNAAKENGWLSCDGQLHFAVAHHPPQFKD